MINQLSIWVRQSRYRAKQLGCVNRLTLPSLHVLLAEYAHRCAYCGKRAVTLDHPFPLPSGAPNVQANCLPCCKKCKDNKKAGDLIVFMNDGHLTQRRFYQLLKQMFLRDGGPELKQFVIEITGHIPAA